MLYIDAFVFVPVFFAAITDLDEC